jgi:hypothetical protein
VVEEDGSEGDPVESPEGAGLVGNNRGGSRSANENTE